MLMIAGCHAVTTVSLHDYVCLFQCMWVTLSLKLMCVYIDFKNIHLHIYTFIYLQINVYMYIFRNNYKNLFVHVIWGFHPALQDTWLHSVLSLTKTSCSHRMGTDKTWYQLPSQGRTLFCPSALDHPHPWQTQKQKSTPEVLGQPAA